jgi:hypothetical protein
VRKGKEESNVGAQEAQQESKVRVSGLRNLLWLASSLALMALLTGVFFGLHSRHLLQDFSVRSGSPVESHLGLRLERAGSDWRFSWNPDAPAISKAMKGNLSITDGTFPHELPVDPYRDHRWDFPCCA